MKIRCGLDMFERIWPGELNGARAGFLVHPASVNRKLVHAVHILRKSKKIELKALFGPQHGIKGETQDNMVEWEGFRDKGTGLPVFSLYGHTRKPEPGMLKGLDVLIVDLQDVGSRYYTFIWTMELCMQACLELNKSVVVLDRPNPISGEMIEGPVLKEEYRSFVGQRPLPVRHGMTVGEIATYFRSVFYPDLDFFVLAMQGWRRGMWYDKTGLPWVMPSPNMPTPDTALVYPGMCLLEGTNLSEGRGTTRPFEIFGAPFIQPEKLAKRLRQFDLPGVVFRPLYFQPTFQKHEGVLCGGAQMHVLKREQFKPFASAVAVLKAVKDLYPDHFRWNQPPYEYETEKMPIDILAGSDRLRKGIESGEELADMETWWSEESRAFSESIRKAYLMYE